MCSGPIGAPGGGNVRFAGDGTTFTTSAARTAKNGSLARVRARRNTRAHRCRNTGVASEAGTTTHSARPCAEYSIKVSQRFRYSLNPGG